MKSAGTLIKYVIGRIYEKKRRDSKSRLFNSQ